MAPSELASEKFSPPAIPLRAMFPFAKGGVSRTNGGGAGAELARAAQAPCRGLEVASDPPTDQPKAIPRAGSRLRRRNTQQ
eukprot:6176784-Pleurochrysis_carterae.AAC.2